MELPEMEVDNERTVIQPADTSIEVDVFDDGSKFILNKQKGKEKISIKSSKQVNKQKKTYYKPDKTTTKLTTKTKEKFEKFSKKRRTPKTQCNGC